MEKRMKKILVTFILALTFVSTSEVFAKVKINSINFYKKSNVEGIIEVKYSGVIKKTPDFTLTKTKAQIQFFGATVWPKIEKQITVNGIVTNASIMGYQYNADVSRVRLVFDYNIEDFHELISLEIKDGLIEIHFPYEMLSTSVISNKNLKSESSSTVVKANDLTRKSQKQVKLVNNRSVNRLRKVNVQKVKKIKPASDYDEDYLNKLLKDKELKVKNEVKVSEDKVEMMLSGVKKDLSANNKSNYFEVGKYIGKFAGLLVFVVLLFLGVIQLLKKGVVSKGKLGLFNSKKIMSVLNTTYIGHKKNLMLVKAHNQVFLIGTDEKGIHFLSEIKDVVGLLKEGESVLTGDNFDISLKSAPESNFNLKKDIAELASVSDLKDQVRNVDIKQDSKLSDHIKKKIKNLKPLQ